METTTLDLTKILKVGDVVYSAISGKDVEVTNADRTITTDTGYIYYANGSYSEDGECMIFPSKDNRDWSTYKRPLVEGEFYSYKNSIFIHKKYKDNNLITSYLCATNDGNNMCISSTKDAWHDANSNDYTVATEEQRKLILDLIDKEGYVYNAKTVELDKKPHEFKPFDKVLVRDGDDHEWRANWFSHYNSDGTIVCASFVWNFTIPYEGNEHLVGTTDSPNQ